MKATPAGDHGKKHLTLKDGPILIYGTAWKEHDTAEYVQQAIRAGFRYIDTAAQPKHYFEEGVGDGWTAAAEELSLHRSDLFLQTKYSPGQDGDRLPYDPTASYADQVHQSLQSSLRNLQTDYLDSWVLHSPLREIEDTMAVWRAMESAVQRGVVRQLGISNCYDMHTFTHLYEHAVVKPTVLQNRFYADSNFDTELRHFCRDHGVMYQSFWTLTANRHALASKQAHDMAHRKHLTPQTMLYAFLMSLGYVTPLDGTKNHFDEDVALMERMRNGEKFFESDEELQEMADLLGMPEV